MQLCDYSHPPIMDWTVLPARIAAKAWTDPVFRQNLLSEPTQIIRTMAPKSCPQNITFHVHENTESVRHFPLPAFRAELAALPHDVLLQGLENETGGETAFEWFLPAPVVFRALTDPTYKECLIADSKAVLRSDGFTINDLHIKVCENTMTSHHLALPVNLWKDEEIGYDALVEKYVRRMLGEA